MWGCAGASAVCAARMCPPTHPPTRGGTHLDDDGVAGKQGRCEGVEDVVEGVVPRNDGPHHPHRHILHTRRLVKHLRVVGGGGWAGDGQGAAWEACVWGLWSIAGGACAALEAHPRPPPGLPGPRRLAATSPSAAAPRRCAPSLPSPPLPPLPASRLPAPHPTLPDSPHPPRPPWCWPSGARGAGAAPPPAPATRSSRTSR